jgi:hypothetical protein
MSDDLLQRAVRALRQEADGPSAAPLNKGAILEQIEADRRNHARRMAIVTPLAALLLTSTAIAAATGTLPVAWLKVKALVMPTAEPAVEPAAELPDSPPRHRPQVRAATQPGQPESLAPPENLAPPEQAPPQPAPLAEPAQAPQPAQPDPSESLAQRPDPASARPRTAQKAGRSLEKAPAVDPAPAASAVPAPPEPQTPPPADGLDLFRRAQQLQFKQQQWQAALNAWDAYLAGQEHGALAPEARWNRAVCLLRLHRTAEARRALQPFAQGAEGGYRQAEAQALLRALDDGPEQ